MKQPTTLGDFFEEEEARLRAKAKEEMAKEDQFYKDNPEALKKKLAEYEEKFGTLPDDSDDETLSDEEE